jgi:hypothetical protein
LKWIVNLAFGVAVSAALLYMFWRSFGPFGLVYAMPVLAILGKPLVEIGASLPRLAARIAMRKFEGRYYEFRGRSMDIHIDADARCWVSTADARKITPLPADLVLNRMAPLECRELGDPVQWRITPEGLAQVLAKSSDPDVTKFCNWLEKDVARPARNRRDGRKVPG